MDWAHIAAILTITAWGMVELYILLGERWIETGVRFEADGVYSSANINIVKHYKIHNKATQGSR